MGVSDCIRDVRKGRGGVGTWEWREGRVGIDAEGGSTGKKGEMRFYVCVYVQRRETERDRKAREEEHLSNHNTESTTPPPHSA